MSKIAVNVIVEGCNEEEYLNFLLKSFNLSNTLACHFENFEGGGVINAFYRYLDLADNQDFSHVKNYIIMFDSEKDTSKIKKQILNTKNSYGYNIIVLDFKPCLEGFLIAHFENNIEEFQKDCYNQTLMKQENRRARNRYSICGHCEYYLREKKYLPAYSKKYECLKFEKYMDRRNIKLAHSQCGHLQNLIKFFKEITTKD